jgi:fumarate reductase subunit C
MKKLRFFIAFFGLNIIIYLIYSFIVLDINPMNWYLFQSMIGRGIIVFIEIICIIISNQFTED